MKRIVAIILLMMISVSFVSVFAEEEFALHNGTKFGMTRQEVIEIEQSAGFGVDPDSKMWNESVLYGQGEIANQKGSQLWYYFTDGLLSRLDYELPIDSYDVIENGLVKKYGDTLYTSEAGTRYPAFRTIGISTIPHNDAKKYSQRIVSIRWR